jgi:hypothetical protein
MIVAALLARARRTESGLQARPPSFVPQGTSIPILLRFTRIPPRKLYATEPYRGMLKIPASAPSYQP